MTETSYIVLGLLEMAEPATPYDLKGLAQRSVFNFWSIPHTQIYAECERLAAAGLLDERREKVGRRRRIYSLTSEGQEALDAWRAEPTNRLYEVRDLGVLKLFFGADPAKLASAQVEAHQRKLVEYKAIGAEFPQMPDGSRLALEMGIAHERESIRLWSELGAAKRE